MEFPDAIRLVAAVIEQAVRDKQNNEPEICPHTSSKEHAVSDCANSLVSSLTIYIEAIADEVTPVDIADAFVGIAYHGG